MTISIHNPKSCPSVELDVKPLLKKAGYEMEWVYGKFDKDIWIFNGGATMYSSPSETSGLYLSLIGPDALEIANVIETQFPKFDIHVIETARPEPGCIAKLWSKLKWKVIKQSKL